MGAAVKSASSKIGDRTSARPTVLDVTNADAQELAAITGVVGAFNHEKGWPQPSPHRLRYRPRQSTL
jgi:hypothetical protein